MFNHHKLEPLKRAYERKLMAIAEMDKPHFKYKRCYIESLGKYTRSSWERELIEVLEELGIEYLYEPQRFYFEENESYLPDLYLPEYNLFIEVKGYYDERSQRKVQLFLQYHGDKYNFLMFMKSELELVREDKNNLFWLIEQACMDSQLSLIS